MELLKLPEKKKYNINVFAELEIELPSHINLSPDDIKISLTRGFISSKNRKKKSKPKKMDIKDDTKERVYVE